jgi:hypothetical protein
MLTITMTAAQLFLLAFLLALGGSVIFDIIKCWFCGSFFPSLLKAQDAEAMEYEAGHSAYGTTSANNVYYGVDIYDDGYESGTDSDYDHESESDSDHYESENECSSVWSSYPYDPMPALRRSPRLVRQGRVDYCGY